MNMFVLCVAWLTLFVNYLVQQFEISVGLVDIVLLIVMEVMSTDG